MVDMLLLPTGGVKAFGVVRHDTERTGQKTMVRAERTRSSTQLLLFSVTETILCPGWRKKKTQPFKLSCAYYSPMCTYLEPMLL